MPKTLTDFIRISLYIALVTTLVLLFQAWDKDRPKKMLSEEAPTQSVVNNDYIPSVSDVAKSAPLTHKKSTAAQPIVTKDLIHVKTDIFDVKIDPVGGNIAQVDLLAFPEKLHSPEPYVLLNDNAETKYIAQSGLLSSTGPDTQKGQAFFTAKQTQYNLAPDQQQLTVDLVWENDQGIIFTKSFIFNRNSYEIGVQYRVNNVSKQDWEGRPYLQLMRKNTPPEHSQGFANFSTFFGAAISSSEKPFQKISFKEMNNNNLSQTIKGGWAAMIQHYFISAWIPNNTITSQYFTRVTSDGLYTVGMIQSPFVVPAGTTATSESKFYAGPAEGDLLEKAAPGLKLTIDYGWFWMISGIIFWMMQKIHQVIGNWGWSIVIVTLIIKLLFYHLSAKSYRSMSALKRLQPRINALKERFGDDKQKFTQATLELYKKEKVNPMSGCLPILVQIPVFIALYWVLIESVELRQAPFILWIQDLSTKDPYYILPVLMGLSMFLQQRLNPPPPDPMQAKVMMFMPILFTVLFLNFPAGLMLYWFVNNATSFLQQWYIMRTIGK